MIRKNWLTGRSTEDAVLCAGYRGATPCPAPTEAERRPATIRSRVKRLAQGDMMLASYHTGYYLSQSHRRIAASLLLPLWGNLKGMEETTLKLTRHNGRSGKHGTYNPKHNDRRFDVTISEHIDEARVAKNVYWDCVHGLRTAADQNEPDKIAETFSEVELLFYKRQYDNFVDNQNERNAKTRHTERNRSIEQILQSKKTCPEETVFQIGTLDDHAPPEVLLQVVTDFIAEMDRRFGEHFHTLNWALHLDESTPHIHERHVFDCENKYGEIAPQQEKALEALGFDLPEPDKPSSRKNNRKMTFDSACRAILFDIAKSYGLHLDEEPEYGGRKYLEKQDFILFKQKEQMAVQEQKLEELILKIDDVEQLLDDVSEVAYDKAVEVVTDKVREQTQTADIKLLDDYQKAITSPKSSNSPQVKKIADQILNKAKDKIREAAGRILQTVLDVLLKPETRKSGKEEIKKKAKESIYARLEQAREDAERHNRERKESAENMIQKHKQNMDL